MAEGGRVRVPEFQRGYVWVADDVRKLFDSILRGFPIGTLLLWRRRADAGTVSFGPYSIKVEEEPRALWVVDGQQRISTLTGVLAPESPEGMFRLWFDLHTRKFVHGSKSPAQPWYMPVNVMRSSARQNAWARSTEGLDEDDLNLADRVGGAIRDYAVQTYEVEEASDELLREIFDRTNNSGRRLRRSDIFHALFAKPGATSAAAVADEIAATGFGRLDPQRVVNSLLAIRGGDVSRDLHGEFSEDEDPGKAFDDTADALRRVTHFLRGAGVAHLTLLPLEYVIPVLAAFYARHPDPEPWSERLLERWLWRVSVFGYGSGATEWLRTAVNAVTQRPGEPGTAPNEHDAVKALLEQTSDGAPPALTLHPFRSNSAHGRIAMAALAALGPLSPDGAAIDVARLLDDVGVDGFAELVRGHRADLGARAFWPRDAGRVRPDLPSDVLQSHAIDAPAIALFQRGDIAGFVQHREAAIVQRTNDFVRARAQPGQLALPSIGSLFVPDEDAG